MPMLTKLFGFNPKETTIRTEIFAGITTFLTMSYILAVNPAMFSVLDGMPAGAAFTATALAAVIGTLVMAFWAKLPFGLAPGMGLNAFFVYTVCLGMGYPWQFALTAVLIEGLLFILLTVTKMREAIVNAIPLNLRYAIGAGIGAAVGAGAGVLIGKKMDKAAAEAAAIEGAQVEQITDNNGLQAVKVTFDSGILFGTGASALSSEAKASLSKFANNVLKQNPEMDVDIYGYTDNQGWKNSTAEQSKQKNLNLSQERAQSVSTYLMSCGVAGGQIQKVEGLGEADPIADNSTAAGRQENRRVEVYMYASAEMIQQAEAGTLQ